MKRLTTDTPKDNLETALNLFYIKDNETWVRGYGPAPEYADVSLFDLTRDIVKTHIPDAELPADDDALSNMMPEWLMDGIDSAEGVVALLYTAAWAYAELRHKLMRYEDAEQDHNGPLTKDELRSRVGGWVWVVVNYEHCKCDGWAFIPTPAFVSYLDQTIPIDFYGKKFIAYDHKSEDGNEADTV